MCGVLGISSARPLAVDERDRGFSEGDGCCRCQCLWVYTIDEMSLRLQCFFSGLGQSDFRVWAKPHISPSTIELIAHHPERAPLTSRSALGRDHQRVAQVVPFLFCARTEPFQLSPHSDASLGARFRTSANYNKRVSNPPSPPENRNTLEIMHLNQMHLL